MQFSSILFFIVFWVLCFFFSIKAPIVSLSHGKTILDMDEKEVLISKSPKKALVLPIILTEYLTINNGIRGIAATSNPAKLLAEKEFFGKFYSGLSNIKVAYNSVLPNVEEIKKQSYDIVFSWGELSGNLKNAGVNVVNIHIGKNASVDRLVLWNLISSITHNHNRANNFLGFYHQIKQDIKKEIIRTSETKPKVLLLYRTGNNMMLLGNKYYNLNNMLDFIGAENIAKDYTFRNINLEQLFLLNPDYIFINSGPTSDSPDSFYKNPYYQSLKAVKNKTIYKMPIFPFMNASTNIVLDEPIILSWMSEILYPATSQNFVKLVKMLYKKIYNFQITDEQINKLIYFDENKNSLDYDRFKIKKDIVNVSSNKS